jgi:D-alanyl-D-alanine dipeptidase
LRHQVLPLPTPTTVRTAFSSTRRQLVFALFAALYLGSPVFLGAQAPEPLTSSTKPPAAPARWKGIIGEYGPEDKPVSLLEKNQRLNLLDPSSGECELQPAGQDSYTCGSDQNSFRVKITVDSSGNATQVSFKDNVFPRRKEGPQQGQVFRITPQRPVEELRKQALADSPPQEPGPFRKPELVELKTLDPAIHLDIRYATTNDFLGTPVYTQARAFMQRPAAEALVRALHKLEPFGYGLLIHDAYRPWYVTKIFWDATPPEGKIFVADPKEGSRHNRGCAVDLTLYDLKTGKPIEMAGTYDEMSPRSFPDYPGGTSLQRWHRDLLRRAMESEGFTVYEHEWWHFDYKDWREYPILNVKFEDLHSGQGLASAP